MNRRKFLEVSGAVTASGGLALGLAGSRRLPLRSGKTSNYHVGVEYYRAPMPPMEMWDEDFAAIKRAGFDSVRTFSSWNWMSPEPGKIELGDFDRMFELAAKHGLKVIFDFTLSTHMACPDWMMRKTPGHESGLPHGRGGRALWQLRRRAGRQSTLLRPSHVEGLCGRGVAGGGQPL